MEFLYKELTGKIVDCAITVHKLLGPGLLESAYEECLLFELQTGGLPALKQIPMPLVCKDKKLDIGYRIDLSVDEKVIIFTEDTECYSTLSTNCFSFVLLLILN
jgi:GxxExxY protein